MNFVLKFKTKGEWTKQKATPYFSAFYTLSLALIGLGLLGFPVREGIRGLYLVVS
jgi:hypothetical protein